MLSFFIALSLLWPKLLLACAGKIICTPNTWLAQPSLQQASLAVCHAAQVSAPAAACLVAAKVVSACQQPELLLGDEDMRVALHLANAACRAAQQPV
jgi:hypothetical protein